MGNDLGKLQPVVTIEKSALPSWSQISEDRHQWRSGNSTVPRFEAVGFRPPGATFSINVAFKGVLYNIAKLLGGFQRCLYFQHSSTILWYDDLRPTHVFQEFQPEWHRLFAFGLRIVRFQGTDMNGQRGQRGQRGSVMYLEAFRGSWIFVDFECVWEPCFQNGSETL